jgi:hypothetical protein
MGNGIQLEKEGYTWRKGVILPAILHRFHFGIYRVPFAAPVSSHTGTMEFAEYIQFFLWDNFNL